LFCRRCSFFAITIFDRTSARAHLLSPDCSKVTKALIDLDIDLEGRSGVGGRLRLLVSPAHPEADP